MRTSIYAVPDRPTVCVYPKTCVYRANGVCDEPRTNKGNSDAACHRLPNKTIILELVEIPGVQSR